MDLLVHGMGDFASCCCQQPFTQRAMAKTLRPMTGGDAATFCGQVKTCQIALVVSGKIDSHPFCVMEIAEHQFHGIHLCAENCATTSIRLS